MSDSVPAGLDVSVAHNARVWNYWLGGKDHYAADRSVGDEVIGMFPGVRDVALADRAFLGRVVRELTRLGISQFLDIGTGLPTADNTHQVAQRDNPDAHVVYVDNDPLVLVHARALLTGTKPGSTAYVNADVHDPAEILSAAAATIDFTRPVAVMMLGVLNFVQETREAQQILHHIMDAMPTGSYLAITHPTVELGGEANIEAMRFWNDNAVPPIVTRTHAEIETLLSGLRILPPGLVSCSQWRPTLNEQAHHPQEVAQYGALAHKP